MLRGILRHPWIVAACNLLLVMALYSLSRLFFYLTNTDLYPDVSKAHLWEMIAGGMRFDLTATLYLSSLYLLLMLLPLSVSWRNNIQYQRTSWWLYLIPNAIGLAINTADMVYVRFTGRRTTCTFFSEFQNDNNLANIFFEAAVQYWYVSLFGIVIIVLLVWLSGKRFEFKMIRPVIYYPIETAVLLFSVYFVIIGIRGGFGSYTRPITISNATQYTANPGETAIVLNTPFCLMKSLENQTYINPTYFSPEELELIMTPIHSESVASVDRIGKTNVVILILESFSKEYIGYYNHSLDGGTYKGYTPFLDSLLSISHTYEYSYASGRKSIDAMPSVLSSIPMMIEPYIVTPYATNAVSSLADVLNSEGYSTAFFHGAPNGSMGFQAYARSAGFRAYYGMDEYDGPSAFDGTWAIWDEEFLLYFGRTMTTMKEPFMTAVFTASSHHPFRVPERYKGVFPEGTHPIHQCIGYTDSALRQFFDYASKQPWFAHTLFILTADHTNQITRSEYNNARGLFAIPIAFYTPSDSTTAGLDTTQVISQTDIMPSVLNYLGYNKPYFAFGEDALTQKKVHNYAICYNHPYFQLMKTDTFLQYDGISALDSTPENNYLKAYIQQYIERMIGNKLRVEDTK